jgi:hypothetical protein
MGPSAWGIMVAVTLLPLTLLLPVLLLLLMLGMEKVEGPLREDAVSEQIESFLDSARPDEVETFVSEGFAPALDRYWKRRRLGRLLPGRSRTESRAEGRTDGR